MGDICLSDEVNFLNHLNQTVVPFFQVAETCLTDETNDDEDTKELKSKLREALLDGFATVSFCITQLNEEEVKKKLNVNHNDVLQVVGQILKFYEEVQKF